MTNVTSKSQAHLCVGHKCTYITLHHIHNTSHKCSDLALHNVYNTIYKYTDPPLHDNTYRFIIFTDLPLHHIHNTTQMCTDSFITFTTRPISAVFFETSEDARLGCAVRVLSDPLSRKFPALLRETEHARGNPKYDEFDPVTLVTF